MENIFSSAGVVEVGVHQSESAKGIDYDVTIGEATHRIVMITEFDANVDVPYMYNETRIGNDKVLEEALAKVIQHEVEKGNEWAKNMKETAMTVWNMIKEEGGAIDYPLSDCDVHISPCIYDYEKSIHEAELKDIEYYLVYSNVVNGGRTIFELTTSLVNYEQIKGNYEKSMNSLQEFYESKILPIEDKPRDELTEEDRENFGTYSDWHKDIYGHRPRTGNDECQKAYLEKSVTENVKESKER